MAVAWQPPFFEIAEKIYATRLEMRHQDTVTSHAKNEPGSIYTEYNKVVDIYSQLGVALNRNIKAENDDLVYIKPSADSLITYKSKADNSRLINMRNGCYRCNILSEAKGAVVSISGKGWVVSQNPAPGTPIKQGMKVSLTQER